MTRLLATRLSHRINSVTEALVAALMVALVLDVWIGVLDRYWFGWQLPWPETFARYLMIWAALLAVSSGIARREHIGLTALIAALPSRLRHLILVAVDILAIGLFLYVFWFGIGFAQSGSTRQAMIFGATLAPFYWAIPVSAALAVVQLILVIARDWGTQLDDQLDSSETAS
ncbi:MAG: TRAP transporter small permease [Aestuariivita sp.]|nr:TRAP transporter small permease [Aestuariivita sp.]MCY4201022.1 TRAP transporter small permease [Aestuariivita sp.]MCY4287385.1 TRAP transporter small permease [Aestuariivita sp.]MCY4347857.1 TRAP transporter small permease [Aestuariivita sp.]